MSSLRISVVLTHFNKGPLLQRTIQSLNPDLPELTEIIVVDDCSTDPQWPEFSKYLEELYFPKVKIIRNQYNQGPARRLNQGGNIAQGDYIFFMDSDDVLVPNRLKDIALQLQATHCDLFYGNKVKTHNIEVIHQHPIMDTIISDDPLSFIIQHNIMEMCVMCSKVVWGKSGGCNPSLFIQDESLSLKLGSAAQKLLFTETPTVFVILDKDETKQKRDDNRLSQNLNQQHHDTFFTIYDFINSNQLTQSQQHKLKQKALSTYWKSLKSRDKKSFIEFIYYILGKSYPEKWWIKRQAHLKSYFEQLNYVRKPN